MLPSYCFFLFLLLPLALNAFIMLSLNSLSEYKAFLQCHPCWFLEVAFPLVICCFLEGLLECLLFPPSCVLLSGLLYILGNYGSGIGWHVRVLFQIVIHSVFLPMMLWLLIFLLLLAVWGTSSFAM